MDSPGPIGEGLAWSYYYGYLKIILPGLHARLKKSEYIEEGGHCVPKFVVLVPISAVCPPSLVTPDDCSSLKYLGPLDFKVDISGNVKRSYQSSVYKVIDSQDNKVRYQAICVRVHV